MESSFCIWIWVLLRIEMLNIVFIFFEFFGKEDVFCFLFWLGVRVGMGKGKEVFFGLREDC